MIASHMHNHRLPLFLIATASVIATDAVVRADIPPRPEEIIFAPLDFEPPPASQYRRTLSNGVVVFLAPSHEFPLVNIAFTFKGGEYLDPPGKTGVGGATGAMMRRGGTTSVKPEDLDERFDFLAANAGVNVGGTQSAATLNCLASNLDEAFGLFMDMLRHPGFDQKRLDVYKGEVIEALKQRNDSADSILAREWSALLYGRDHFEAAEPTKASIESITRDDLLATHQRLFHPAPGNLYIAVTGDFEEPAMLARLEAALKDWPAGEVPGDPPAPTATFAPGVYHVEKDIPQGKVFVGLRGIRRDDPDAIPVLLMNNILGGGGFTSRITNRVRSDEGLAYSAGSRSAPRVWYPGELAASFQSKSNTCALAIKIILEEIEKVRAEPVTGDELDIAKKAIIETFPRTFESKPAMLGVFINDEMTRRPQDWWRTYRDKVNAVTPVDIQRVAQKHLQPERMAIFVVGKWDDIYQGDPQGRASMQDFFKGDVTHIPLRDPLTLEEPKN
jgi:zinc protease